MAWLQISQVTIIITVTDNESHSVSCQHSYWSIIATAKQSVQVGVTTSWVRHSWEEANRFIIIILNIDTTPYYSLMMSVCQCDVANCMCLLK